MILCIRPHLAALRVRRGKTRTLGFMAARRARNVLMTVVLVLWVSSASALDRSGAIDVAKRQVRAQCTPDTPCTFNATLHERNWHVRVQFTKRNSPKEEPFPYRGGHAILIVNQTGKVIGRMEGE
jgi:hypothetical protein